MPTPPRRARHPSQEGNFFFFLFYFLFGFNDIVHRAPGAVAGDGNQ